MEKIWLEPGQIYNLEKSALENETRVKILEIIGLDLKRLEDLQDEVRLKEQELNLHLVLLEQAMLLERDEECYRLTPRCLAYLDQCHGYELRR
ncbi:MAG: hypothetical protein LUQ38_08705 [Methanotrichaceae archaeon]|nr:hypothetical protein [Methanotrichaceae archaeon]MDD1757208.1 hypothetical protein [Methanotrichaceae archaeon]